MFTYITVLLYIILSSSKEVLLKLFTADNFSDRPTIYFQFFSCSSSKEVLLKLFTADIFLILVGRLFFLILQMFNDVNYGATQAKTTSMFFLKHYAFNRFCIIITWLQLFAYGMAGIVECSSLLAIYSFM